MNSYTIPSKTFFLGEYLALNAGPALIYASKPCFELTLSPSQENTPLPFHPESPAGRYFQGIKGELANVQITFSDPHQGQGGLGASSAQFVALYTAYQRLLKPNWTFSKANIPALLDTYINCAWNGKGLPPSGYDVIAQAQGGLCFIDRRGDDLQTVEWPFPQLNFYLLRTGKKLATHEHLQSLDKVDSDALKAPVYAAKQALENGSAASMIQAVNAYASHLIQYGLCAPHTRNMLDELTKHPACLAAKGCGAMGADVVLCLVDSHRQQHFSEWLNTQGWTVIVT